MHAEEQQAEIIISFVEHAPFISHILFRTAPVSFRSMPDSESPSGKHSPHLIFSTFSLAEADPACQKPHAICYRSTFSLAGDICRLRFLRSRRKDTLRRMRQYRSARIRRFPFRVSPSVYRYRTRPYPRTEIRSFSRNIYVAFVCRRLFTKTCSAFRSESTSFRER